MLIYQLALLVFVFDQLCRASAFSTRFVMEGVEEEKKPQAAEETRTQKMVENKTAEGPNQAIEVKVIPIATEVFTQTEPDLFSMTPLKLVTAVAAEHLITSVQNIPVAGNSAQDTLDMLEGIVKDLNKTAQIIKLTAEYVNISGHYMLSTLKEAVKTSCQQNVIDKEMQSIRTNFLRTIVRHIVAAVKEMTEKTREREITGDDILVSSAYHTVAAFQDMTNEVLNLSTKINKKCNTSLPAIQLTPLSELESNVSEKKATDDTLAVEVVPEQGKSHKSIKKDQAVPKFTNKFPQMNFDNFQDTLTMENLNGNQDLTVEVFSPESFLKTNKEANLLPNRQEQMLTPNNNKKSLPLNRIILSKGFTQKGLSVPDLRIDNNELKPKVNIDKELASSAVDSLSNVPWTSDEPELKGLNKNRINKIGNTPMNFFNVLDLIVPRPKSRLECDEQVEPVCGIDKSNNKFIIFLNECKRTAHNQLYGTNYVWTPMDTCVGLMLRNPNYGSAQQKSIDLRPR